MKVPKFHYRPDLNEMHLDSDPGPLRPEQPTLPGFDNLPVTKSKPNKKPIHQQLSDLKNWEQKNKEKSLSKIVKTPIGDMKIINTNQKDIANKQPRKKYESL